MKFEINVKRSKGEEYEWDFEGKYGEDTFGIKVKKDDKYIGLEAIENSLVMKYNFGIVGKKECEDYLAKNHDLDIESIKSGYQFVINYL